MDSISNCQPSEDDLILPSLTDVESSPHERYSPAEQNNDSQPASSTVQLSFQFFVVSHNKAMLPQKCFYAAIGSKMDIV